MRVTINPMKVIMVQVLSISVPCIYLQCSAMSEKDKEDQVSAHPKQLNLQRAPRQATSMLMRSRTLTRNAHKIDDSRCGHQSIVIEQTHLKKIELNYKNK